eukprot:8068681-Pyramimonas_sp.AAC.1
MSRVDLFCIRENEVPRFCAECDKDALRQGYRLHSPGRGVPSLFPCPPRDQARLSAVGKCVRPGVRSDFTSALSSAAPTYPLARRLR